MTADEYLKLASEAYKTSTTFFDSSIRKQVEASIRQFQGVHPAGSKYHSDLYKSRSRFFRPKTRTTIRKNEAVAAEAFFSTNDVVAITPDDDNDEAQLASAEIMQGLLDYRLKKTIPWFLICMGAYQDAQTVGVCLSYHYWKYDAAKKIDQPCCDLLPVENARIDPGANWADPVNTSPYFIRLIPMYVKDVKARMKTVDPKTGAPKWKTLDDSQIMAAMNAGGDTTRQTRERGRTDSTDQSQAIREFAIVWVHENIVEIEGHDQVWYTLATVGMLTEPKPIEEVYHHGKRPYVMGYSVIETHKTYPDGVAGITKDTQAEINEIANQTRDTVKFALNKRYFAKRGAQVDVRSLTRNVPGSVTFMTDIEKDVRVQETGEVNPSAYQEQDRLNLDFDDVAGSFSSSSVQSNRKLNETVGGMAMISNSTNQVGNYQLRTFVETWMEPALRLHVLLEQHYETDEVILAKAGKNSKAFQKMGMGKVTDDLLMHELTLNVNVGIGATNPQERVNNFMLGMTNLKNVLQDGALERYGLDVSEVIKELFGKLGYKDGGRFFDTETQDPRLVNAQATIAQLQQQLAQKTDPALTKAQIDKLNAEVASLAVKDQDIKASTFEKNMRAFFASGQAAQMIAAVPQLASLMDALAQAAGYQEPLQAQDPDLPMLGAPAVGLTQGAVKDPRTGIEFLPGVGTDTTPLTPATPGTGAEQGIETIEAEA